MKFGQFLRLEPIAFSLECNAEVKWVENLHAEVFNDADYDPSKGFAPSIDQKSINKLSILPFIFRPMVVKL